MDLPFCFPTYSRVQSTGRFGSALQLVTILVIFVLIIVLAYFATKWVAGYQKVKGASPNIEVLESYRVAPAKFIAIVRVGGKYLAISVGKDEMSLLCELSKEDLVIRGSAEQQAAGFSALLEKFRAAQGGPTGGKRSSEEDQSSDRIKN